MVSRIEGVASRLCSRLLIPKRYVWLGGILLITGCAQQEDLLPAEEERVPVHFTASLPVSAATRTTNGGNYWVNGDLVGIYMKYASVPLTTASCVEQRYNKQYVVRCGMNTNMGTMQPRTQGDVIYFPNQDHVDFIAYYPYTDAVKIVDNNMYFVLPLDSVRMMDQSTEENRSQIDILYSDNQRDRYREERDSIRFSFRHVMSKLRINLIADRSMQGTDFSRVSAEVCKVPYCADLALGDGITFRDILIHNSKTISMWRWDSPETSSYAATYEAILVPGTTPGREVRFTTEDDRSFTWKLGDGDVFEPGKIHVWDITIIDTSVSGRSKQAAGAVASAPDIQVLSYTVVDRDGVAQHPDLCR
ncbi:MAG: fimbrillin family protein [Bacteroides sp.]|nr:fimbrillin family protein [Bacteroides sp.]